MCDNFYWFLPSYGMLEDPYRHIRKDWDREDQERKERKQREREEREERKRLKCKERKERKARKAAEQTRFPADLSDSKEEERALKRSRVVKPPLQSAAVAHQQQPGSNVSYTLDQRVVNITNNYSDNKICHFIVRSDDNNNHDHCDKKGKWPVLNKTVCTQHKKILDAMKREGQPISNKLI